MTPPSFEGMNRIPIGGTGPPPGCRAMPSSPFLLLRRGVRIVALGAAFAGLTGCENGSSGPEPDPTAGVTTYTGTWTQYGTSKTRTATKTLTIGANFSYEIAVNQYESKLTLAWIQSTSATVTALEIDEANAAYETRFIDIHEIEITPQSGEQADRWNSDEYGGLTT
jgi:hypothetical protein